MNNVNLFDRFYFLNFDVNRIELCNYKRYYKRIRKYIKIHLYINNKEIVKILYIYKCK